MSTAQDRDDKALPVATVCITPDCLDSETPPPSIDAEATKNAAPTGMTTGTSGYSSGALGASSGAAYEGATNSPAVSQRVSPRCAQGCAQADGSRAWPDDMKACVSGATSTKEGAATAGAGGRSAVSKSCQILRRAGYAALECAPAGLGAENSPCGSAQDCAPGYACVGQEKAGQCRRYCCAGECDGDTYCAERPLLEPSGVYASSLLAPVCVKAENCRLDEAYPCEAANGCSCPTGTACTVVKNNLTGCVEPGTGLRGDTCPCAPGFVCSSASQTCLELCSLSSSDKSCGTERRCQANPALPSTLGTCTVASGDAGVTTLAGTSSGISAKDAGVSEATSTE